MKKYITYLVALLALVLTTACEQKKWKTELPEGEVEVMQFYNMMTTYIPDEGDDTYHPDMETRPDLIFDIYTKGRDGKLPMMIKTSTGGVDSYNLLDYAENLEDGEISFKIEEVSLATNELEFVATYDIEIDYQYGFAKINISTLEPGIATPKKEYFEASYRTTTKLN